MSDIQRQSGASGATAEAGFAEVMVMPRMWFFAKNKTKCGPYSALYIRKLLTNGVLSPQDMILREGSQKWIPAASLPPDAGASSPSMLHWLAKNRVVLAYVLAVLSLFLGLFFGLLIPRGGTTQLGEELALLKRRLGRAEAEKETAEQQVRQRTVENAKLVDDLTSARRDADKAGIDRQTLEDRVIQLRHETTKLRMQKVEAEETAGKLMQQLEILAETRSKQKAGSPIEMPKSPAELEIDSKLVRPQVLILG